MADYKRLYYFLFNQITEVIELLEQTQREPEAILTLKRIQQDAEESFLDDEEESAELDDFPNNDKPSKSNIISLH